MTALFDAFVMAGLAGGAFLLACAGTFWLFNRLEAGRGRR